MRRNSWGTYAESRHTGRRHKRKCRGLGKRPPKGAGKLQTVIKDKNESVVGRNTVHGARPRKGAELTPWLWTGGTKEVGARLCWT